MKVRNGNVLKRYCQFRTIISFQRAYFVEGTRTYNEELVHNNCVWYLPQDEVQQ